MEELKKGDYVVKLNREQFKELMNFQPEKYGKYVYNPPKQNNIIWNGDYLSVYLNKKINKLTFQEFKRRAINTFENGTEN